MALLLPLDLYCRFGGVVWTVITDLEAPLMGGDRWRDLWWMLGDTCLLQIRYILHWRTHSIIARDQTQFPCNSLQMTLISYGIILLQQSCFGSIHSYSTSPWYEYIFIHCILKITCTCDSYNIEIWLHPKYLGKLPSLGIIYFSFILADFYKIHRDVTSRLRSHYDLFNMFHEA